MILMFANKRFSIMDNLYASEYVFIQFESGLGGPPSSENRSRFRASDSVFSKIYTVHGSLLVFYIFLFSQKVLRISHMQFLH